MANTATITEVVATPSHRATAGVAVDSECRTAKAPWPNVPSCYGWLSLDRRGVWRLKGEHIRHHGMISHINRNYGSDGNGNWLVRNGPQSVYVSLDYTPLVLTLGQDEELATHTGELVRPTSSGWIDEEGNILLGTSLGIGLLDDRDLARFLEKCISPEGKLIAEDTFSADHYGQAFCFWKDVSIGRIRRREVAGRFGFNPEPCAS